jgi:hypothetical protein
MGVRQCQALGRIRSFVGLKVVVNVLYKSLYIFLSIAQKPGSLKKLAKNQKYGFLLKNVNPLL